MWDASQYIGRERRRALFVGWLLVALAIFALVAAVTFCPIGWRPRLTRDPDQERFWAFAVLGVAAKFAAPRRHLQVMACVVAIAVGTEAAQLFIPSRDARLWDAAVKALGAVAGVQAGYAFFKLRRAWKTLAAARMQARAA